MEQSNEPRSAQAEAATLFLSPSPLCRFDSPCPPRVYASDRAFKTTYESTVENLRVIDSCNRRARWRWAQYVQQPRVYAIPDPTLFRLVREHGETMAASAEAQRAWDDSGNHVISEAEASARIARAAQIVTQIDYEYEPVGDCYEEGDL